MLKAVDAIASDGETVALSPAKIHGEAEATNPKKQKVRKIPGIAKLRMDSSELVQMRSKIAKSLTVPRSVCLNLKVPSTLFLPHRQAAVRRMDHTTKGKRFKKSKAVVFKTPSFGLV